jgi:iduronate 2-sulfatase
MEMWEQYSYNNTTPDKWAGWDGLVGTTMDPAWAAELKRFYYAALSHTDEMVGSVLAAVKARGDEGNTIVAFVGDHGT